MSAKSSLYKEASNSLCLERQGFYDNTMLKK